MEVQAEVRVDADPEIVVHHKDLRVVFALRSCCHRRCNVKYQSHTVGDSGVELRADWFWSLVVVSLEYMEVLSAVTLRSDDVKGGDSIAMTLCQAYRSSNNFSF